MREWQGKDDTKPVSSRCYRKAEDGAQLAKGVVKEHGLEL